jgi:hypothetical protein
MSLEMRNQVCLSTLTPVGDSLTWISPRSLGSFADLLAFNRQRISTAC